MSVLDSITGADSIFKQLNTVRTLNNNMPKIDDKSNDIYDNTDGLLNKGQNIVSGKKDLILTFLTKITEVVEGFLSYQHIFVNYINTQTPKLEAYSKDILKEEMTSIVCDSNPEIPTDMSYSGSGISYSLDSVDVLGTYHYSPTSSIGNLLYEDTTLNPTTTDFDNFIYQTIQGGITTPGSEFSWGQSTTGQDILTFKFQQMGHPLGNNIMTVNASQFYSNPVNNLKYVDLINDYLDSITIFNKVQLTNNVLNDILSPQNDIQFTGKKLPFDLLEQQESVKRYLTNIINIDEGDIETIDDSYFLFTDNEKGYISEKATNKHNHIVKFDNCYKNTSSVNTYTLTGLTEDLITATTTTQFQKSLIAGVNSIGDELGSQADNNQDKFAIKLSFFQKIVESLYNNIAGAIITPKLLHVFMIHDVVVYNKPPSNNVMTFMYEHRTLIWNIAKMLITPLITFIVSELIKVISDWLSKKKQDDMMEGNILNITSILSLIPYTNVSKLFEMFRKFI